MRVLVVPRHQDWDTTQSTTDKAIKLVETDEAPTLPRLIAQRLKGLQIVHLHGGLQTPTKRLRRLLRALRVLRLRLVWTLPPLNYPARAHEIENLRLLYHAAHVRIVTHQTHKDQIRDVFGLSGTTFVIPEDETQERVQEATKLAYETSLEPRMPIQDRAQPPRKSQKP